MISRTTLHLLALFGMLVALGGQTARSQPDQRSTPTTAVHQRQPAAAREITTSAAPSQSTLATAAALTNTVYLPSVMRITPPTDLSIESLEITQAIQTPSNSVPLVADRPAIVRVYAKYTGTVMPENVTVSLTGTRGGVALPPITLGPQSVSASPTRAIYSSSFNITLPASWLLAGTILMTATVDSGTTMDESNETNNTATATLKFNPVPTLEIEIVPIRYTHTGKINPGVYAAPTQDTISDFIRRTYPLSAIKVTLHPQINFTGDLSASDTWSNLLDTVAVASNNHPTKVFYGLVSAVDGGETWLPLDGGGFILGIGLVGARFSAGLDIPAELDFPADMTSNTAAHEIGHNLGRAHTPCGLPQGAPYDQNYPNIDASIMQFGVDLSKGTVLNPSTTKDLMSYCDPQWISDYTYTALYNVLSKKTPAATSAAPRASLLIRGNIGSDGTASLAPAYGITGVPDAAPSSSDYRVEFLDAVGNVVASQPVAVSEIEQPHVVSLSQGRLVQQTNALAVRGMATRAPQLTINAIIAAPAQAFSSVRLMRADTVLTTRTLRPVVPAIAAAAPSIERQAAGTLLLRWNAANGPALVRYTADNGATWTTLGVDVPDGELRIDPATLPAGAGYVAITSADSAAPTVRIAVP